MSSLQPALVYKYTITFTAELAGLPWVLAGEARGVSSSTPAWDKPYFSGSAVANPPSSSVFLSLFAGRHKLTCQCSPLDMPFYKTYGNIFLT